MFEAYGAVDRVSIITDRDTGQAKGFGFVEMAANADADLRKSRRFIGKLSRSAPMVRRDSLQAACQMDVARGRRRQSFGEPAGIEKIRELRAGDVDCVRLTYCIQCICIRLNFMHLKSGGSRTTVPWRSA